MRETKILKIRNFFRKINSVSKHKEKGGWYLASSVSQGMFMV